MEFSTEAAKNKIINLNINNEGGSEMVFATPDDAILGDTAYDEPGETGRIGKLMQLASWIDLESRLSVSGCCLLGLYY